MCDKDLSDFFKIALIKRVFQGMSFTDTEKKSNSNFLNGEYRHN